MEDREFMLKEVQLQLSAKFKSDLQKIPLLPGEAGYVSNLILIPSENQLNPDMHVQIKQVKKTYIPFEDFPPDIREALSDLAKELDIHNKRELEKIKASLHALQKDISKLENNEEMKSDFLENAGKLIRERVQHNAEKKYLADFKKFHKGLINCLNLEDLSFLTKDGKQKALNFIDLEQLYQEKFRENVNEE